ncbi:ankyrin repeat domain-containing protein [Mesobacillus maritimus]|uniref:Ankyrin repeat domain-containing protein n=1 Tax=Mesobacillus maritimus TaxID=1643336 RepID=A0ABS7K8H5_9BACI|nr:ankyrin repeat domain-containing protein [Mesobacillus maritimus]MBY0098563.1 ankyrin repeat domain-containing protein [Mesobacillus maritimus]
MNEGKIVKELFHAAEKNDIRTLKEFLQIIPSLANTENEEGLTPLGYAAHFGQKEAVELLLAFGADVNAVSHSKVSYIPSNTALHAAIAGERSLAVIQTLLEHKAKTTIVDSNGHTCLHTAAYHENNPDLIQLLIESGASVSAKGKDGRTALELAEEQGHIKVAEQLRRNPI